MGKSMNPTSLESAKVHNPLTTYSRKKQYSKLFLPPLKSGLQLPWKTRLSPILFV